jgi:hypothetical protein
LKSRVFRRFRPFFGPRNAKTALSGGRNSTP